MEYRKASLLASSPSPLRLCQVVVEVKMDGGQVDRVIDAEFVEVVVVVGDPVCLQGFVHFESGPVVLPRVAGGVRIEDDVTTQDLFHRLLTAHLTTHTSTAAPLFSKAEAKLGICYSVILALLFKMPFFYYYFNWINC